MGMKNYIGCCVQLDGETISNMVQSAKEITYKTFCKYANPADVFPPEKQCPPLNKDWAVRFYKSFYDGKPCVFIDHSAIEYVFV